MKKITALCFVCLLFVVALASCKKEEPINIDATDFVGNYSTNTVVAWSNGSIIGTVSATTNKGNLNYTLVSQNVTGIIAINATTGQITVADKSAFNNPAVCANNNGNGRITAVVRITNDTVTRDINITLTLTNWCI